MSRHLKTDFLGVLKGIQMIASESIKLHEANVKHLWANSSIKNIVIEANVVIKEKIAKDKKIENLNMGKIIEETLQRTSMIPGGMKAFAFYVQKREPQISNEEFMELDKDNIYEEIDVLLHGDPHKLDNKPEKAERSLHISAKEESKQLEKQLPVDKIIKKSPRVAEPITIPTTFAYVPPEKVAKETAGDETFKEESIINTQSLSEDPTYKPEPMTFASPQPQMMMNLAQPQTMTNLVQPQTQLVDKSEKKLVSKEKIIKHKQVLSETAKQRKVPATRLGRMISFGSLAAGLGVGTVAEMTRRSLGLKQEEDTSLSSMFLTPANAERIVNTLCKVRGAALKLGQILSIQDSNVISPVLQEAFERVRQAADFMPESQVKSVLEKEFGTDWMNHFEEFDMKPFAAASIGQVHYGKLKNGTEVAVKIQYPGVAQGIDSDIDNLVSVLNIWNVFPEGLFIDKIIEVAKWELAREVDYVREAECTKKFKELLKPFPEYYIPNVIDQLCTKQIFTTELVEGIPVDKCVNMDIKTREHICYSIMHLCLRELEFRFMQTDPNWSNFFYNQDTKQLVLLDFGASRSYDNKFMDQYMRVIKAASEGDRNKVLLLSREMGFLTGFESKAMENAHVDTVMILGEVFDDNAPFDFGSADTVKRVTALAPTILNQRLCPPPDEIYSLHRKLSGVFLLCSKLRVKMKCRDMFNETYDKYVFGK